jgi:hypothetical protein
MLLLLLMVGMRRMSRQPRRHVMLVLVLRLVLWLVLMLMLV